MKCRVCKQRLRKPSSRAHCREASGMGAICRGCFLAATEIELFLIRAADRTVMGAWAEAWLREILSEPARYRDTPNTAAKKGGKK